MATQVQWRRGTTAQVAAFTGAVGEVVIDTALKQLVVQDGVTAGGFYAAKASGGTYTNITITGASNVLTGATFAGGTFTSPTLNAPTISAPTFSGAMAGSLSGGTFTSPTIATPAVTGGTFASPTLSGTPLTPTQSFADSSTQIVNSAWVRAVIQLSSPINLALAAIQPIQNFNSALGT